MLKRILSLLLVSFVLLGLQIPTWGAESVQQASDTQEFMVETTFEPSVMLPNQMLSAKVKATNVSTESYSGTKDVLVIAALYDSNNTMVNVSYISKGIPYHGTELLTAGFKLPAGIAGHKVKAFMWDGKDIATSNMIPLSNEVELSSGKTTPSPTVLSTPTVIQTPSPTPTITPTTTPSPVPSGVGETAVLSEAFNNGIGSWKAWWGDQWNGIATGDLGVQNGELKMIVTTIGTQSFSPQVYLEGLNFEQGFTYNVSFKARATVERKMNVNIGKALTADPWFIPYVPVQVINLTPSMTAYTFSFNMSEPSYTNGKLVFETGNVSGGNAAPVEIYFDDVKITKTAMTTPSITPGSWNLVWNDEFNGADGSAPDSTKWNLVNSGDGFGNNELQYYTNRIQNSYIEKGNLVIKAMKETYGGRQYTSAKLYTQNKGDWLYGKIEVRAKLPRGRCIWPAIWMMPTQSLYGGWPVSGEIDIMELRGDKMNTVGGTLHYGNPWKYTGASYILPDGKSFGDDFHVFTTEWDKGVIRWYVDGVLYQTQTNWYSSAASFPAPFDQKFYLQLNLAIGGPNTPYTGSQNPDDSVLPQSMLVDYVRIYQR